MKEPIHGACLFAGDLTLSVEDFSPKKLFTRKYINTVTLVIRIPKHVGHITGYVGAGEARIS